ncbi:MAG: signal peptide peptidase SppA, partial [Pseudomonadota bacterium]
FEAVTREEYKSALAQFTESDIPPAVQENMESLIGDLFEQIVEDVAADRNLTTEQLEALIDNAPLNAEAALEGGLIDQIGYRDEFLAAIEEDGEIVSLTGYHGQLTTSEPSSNGIALVQASGPIIQGAGNNSVFNGAMPLMRIDATLEDIIEDDAIEAVILRLDSPGGSPAASEFVRRAVTRVSEAGKPVVVSMAQVAASGGYWIASGADAIVAQPGTFTGSIGVLAGKPNLAGVWEEYDVNWAPIYRGENADIVSTNRPFDARGLAKMDEDIGHVYDAFLERVAESRGFSTEEAREIAKGRVWSGRQAFQVGLVDELGGIETAFRLATAAAGIEVADAVLTDYPRRQSRFDTALELIESFGGITEGLDILNKLSRIAQKTGVAETLEALEAAEQPVRTPLPMVIPQ